jgi:hypothetical protein
VQTIPEFPPLATDRRSGSASTNAQFQPNNVVAARRIASPTTPPPITIRSYNGDDGCDDDDCFTILFASINVIEEVIFPLFLSFWSFICFVYIDDDGE